LERGGIGTAQGRAWLESRSLVRDAVELLESGHEATQSAPLQRILRVVPHDSLEMQYQLPVPVFTVSLGWLLVRVLFSNTVL